MLSNKEKKLYAREFEKIKDGDTILAFDIENMRLVELNEFESGILNRIKRNPSSILELKKIYPSEEAAKVEKSINELISTEIVVYYPIVGKSQIEIDVYNKEQFEDAKKKEMIHFALNICHKCNLNCIYCYEDGGSYGGPSILMDKSIAEQSVNFLFELSGSRKDCRITFFGGEPLMNFSLIKHIVEYAKREASRRNKIIHFGMTTNGFLLDDKKTDYLIKENIEMTFSFDGSKKIQNRNRPLKTKKKVGSYDFIYPKILKFIEKAEKNKTFYCFRATLTRPGLQNIYDVIDFFNGFETEKIYFDFAEYNNIANRAFIITEEDLNSFRKKIKKVAKEFELNRSTRYDSLFSGPIRAIHARLKKYKSCISPGITYVSVSPKGEIFPCHRFLGFGELKLGDVWKGFDSEKWIEVYSKVNIFNSKVCSTCWIRYFCGGLCPATSYSLCGDFVLSDELDQEPLHCKVKKIVYKESMLLYYRLSENLEKMEKIKVGVP